MRARCGSGDGQVEVGREVEVCEGVWKVEEWREVKARGVGGQDWWE